jgi:hypothetical protein
MCMPMAFAALPGEYRFSIATLSAFQLQSRSAKTFPFAWSDSANRRFVFSATCRECPRIPFRRSGARTAYRRRVVFQLSELMTARRRPAWRLAGVQRGGHRCQRIGTAGILCGRLRSVSSPIIHRAASAYAVASAAVSAVASCAIVLRVRRSLESADATSGPSCGSVAMRLSASWRLCGGFSPTVMSESSRRVRARGDTPSRARGRVARFYQRRPHTRQMF